MYSYNAFSSLIIPIQLESSVPSLCNENFSAGRWFVLWPQVLGRRGKGGGRDFYISKYLGGGCRIFREHVQAAMWATGNQSLNESLWQEGRAGCRGPGAQLWCRRQPGPADIILLGKERVETVSICSMFCWDAVFTVSKPSMFLPVLCLSLSSVSEAQQDVLGREKHYKSYLPQMDLDGFGMESNRNRSASHESLWAWTGIPYSLHCCLCTYVLYSCCLSSPMLDHTAFLLVWLPP